MGSGGGGWGSWPPPICMSRVGGSSWSAACSSCRRCRCGAVGSLERALALTMVLLGDYAAVGWIIAAKSLARFKQLEDREFAEYFLVGTLASFLLAVLVGVGIRILLKQA